LVEAYKYLQKYINESCHHLTIFDEMIEDVIQNASNYLENGMFYTGWNFYMKSLFENNKEHLVPACEKLNDIRKYHPIWVIFFKSKYKNYDTDTFASLSYRNIDIPEQLLKNDYIRINLNETYLDDKSFIKASIMHELTHVVNAYCKETNNTLLNKKNTIGYSLEENIFDFSETMLDKISEFLYILNKSE